jgi:N-acyl-D-amino-acid deacylase
MGFEEALPNSDELNEMRNIVRSAMESGCLGLSSGLIYIPCAYAEIEELIELCKIVSEYNGVFVVHQRSEANSILESMDEIIRIGLESGVAIHFSHFKICGKRNWKLITKVLAKLDEAKEKGLKVSFDMYPYTAGSTMLSAILPPWMHVGGTGQMIHRLQDLAIRKMLRKELRQKRAKWDNFVEFAGVNGIYITSTSTSKNEHLIGLNLAQIGKKWGIHPLEAAFDLLIAENNNVGMIDYYGYEEHLKTFVKREEMNACSDGLLGGKPHPRAYGAFPRFISEYVIKDKVLTMEEVIHKMTQRPAQVFGLENRGIIKEGAYADLIMFKEKEFKDMGTYVKPMEYPTGLKLVMVNGQILFDNELKPVKSCGEFIRVNRRVNQ